MRRLYYTLLCSWLCVVSALAQSASYLSFTASFDPDKGMTISWVTSQENRIAHFNVQRTYNLNLSTLANVAGVPSKGSGTLTRSYTFVEVKPPQTGLVYYRLEAVDVDGKVEYTPFISAFIEPSPPQVGPFIIYPDQLGDIVTLKLPNAKQVSAVRIVNMRGVTVLQQELIRNFFVVKTLLSGWYIMEVTTSTGEVLRKLYLKPI